MHRLERPQGRSPRYAAAFFSLAAAALSLGVIDAHAIILFCWPALSWLAVGWNYLHPDAGVFAKRGPTVPTLRKLCILPHTLLLYVVWHATRLFSREPAFAELLPGVLIGRRLLPGEWPAVATVVDLAVELDDLPPPAAQHLTTLLLDGSAPEPTWLRTAPSRIDTAQLPVYIHCAQGHGRTAMFAASLLLHRRLAANVDEALGMVLAVRPHARPNTRQVRALRRAWEAAG